MALTVETGSIVSGADSYISIEDADTYLVAAGNTDWEDADATDKEVALRKACRYVDSYYRVRWKGRKIERTQPLCWPRTGVYDEDGFAIEEYTIPEELRRAQCEAALRLFQGIDLLPDLERGGRVVTEKLDVISTTYADSAPVNTSFQEIDMLLTGLLTSVPGSGLAILDIERAV